jgi:hypothetical protein
MASDTLVPHYILACADDADLDQLHAAALNERAERLGRRAGKAAGTWAIDGNTSADAARALLRGIDEGDPAVLDAMPDPHGDDEFSHEGVLLDLGVHPEGDDADRVLESYRVGFDSGYWAEVERAAHAMLPA